MNNQMECSATFNPGTLNNKSKKEFRKDIKKIPKSALALYIKLYCSRKDTKSLKHANKMIEATKSWITLSESEKQKFFDKYKEYQQKYSDTFINCLQKSEPFMKKRTPRSQRKNEDIDPVVPTLQDSKTEVNVELSSDNEILKTENVILEQITDIFHNDEQIQSEEIQNASLEENNTLQDASKILYPEPVAPSIKSGKEFFEVIKPITENNLTWTTLPQREKSLYNQAILTMKIDYIQKYKLYLEGLTQRELFNHYNKSLQC